VRLLLDHPSVDAAAMMMLSDNHGRTCLMAAAFRGHVEAQRLLLDHPSADAAAMMMLRDAHGMIALMPAASYGNADAMHMMLDHPSAALTFAAEKGNMDAMRVLLDHPSADAAAMMELGVGVEGTTALGFAAFFAVRALDGSDPGLRPRCAPLLLLLRCVAVVLQPCAALKAHMSKVMEALCLGPHSSAMLGIDQPDDVRDECIRLLFFFFFFERGACHPPSPVVSRIIQEGMQLARVPQLLNEAVLGVAFSRQQDQKPREHA
jgi:hypothetical protein